MSQWEYIEDAVESVDAFDIVIILKLIAYVMIFLCQNKILTKFWKLQAENKVCQVASTIVRLRRVG